MATVKTIELELPKVWACPLFYGDTTGLEPVELEQFEAFLKDFTTQYGSCFPSEIEEADSDDELVKYQFII